MKHPQSVAPSDESAAVDPPAPCDVSAAVYPPAPSNQSAAVDPPAPSDAEPARRYPRRNLPPTNYAALESPNEDDFICKLSSFLLIFDKFHLGLVGGMSMTCGRNEDRR